MVLCSPSYCLALYDSYFGAMDGFLYADVVYVNWIDHYLILLGGLC